MVAFLYVDVYNGKQQTPSKPTPFNRKMVMTTHKNRATKPEKQKESAGMNKERIKGIVIGFILCMALSSTVVVMANTRTETRQITFGIRVNLNGQLLDFDADSQPFVMGGRTFLPVRALADALGLPVDFDSATNTAYLGNRHAGVRTPLNVAAPHFDDGGSVWASVAMIDSVSMGGATYQNALRFSVDIGTTFDVSENRFTLHNLNSQYRMLTGFVGRIDGAGMRNATLTFVGDGQVLQSYNLQATEMPIPISVFVEGVTQLRIEMYFPSGRARTGYALIAYLE